MTTRARSRVTEKQRVYVDEVMLGKSKSQAAKTAGYPHAQAPELSLTVKAEIQRARDKLTDLTQIKRLDVIDGIMDGISLARMQGDAGNVIKGWTEVAKILGHYAPEVKQINLNIGQQRLKSKFEALSDDELLAIQNAGVIDVESKTIM